MQNRIVYSLPVWVSLLFAGLFLSVILAGYRFYHDQQHFVRKQAINELQTIAQLKVEQIEKWRHERLADGQLLMHSPFFIEGVNHFFAEANENNTARLLERLNSIRKFQHYQQITLLDRTGDVRLQSGNSIELYSGISQAIEQAKSLHSPLLTDIHQSTDTPQPHFGLVVPLYQDGQYYIGALVMQVFVKNYLYPLLASWPIQTQSAETLLIRRDGNYALFLNPLRHLDNAELHKRIALRQSNVPAIMALQGKAGVVEGVDYRGEPVLAVITPVADSAWYVVTKIDTSEVFAEWIFRSKLILLTITSIIVLFLALFGFLWQFNNSKHICLLAEAESALQKSEELYRTTLLSIGDGVIVTDATGKVTMMNEVAERLTGWYGEEYLRRPLEEVFHIVNEESHIELESPAHIVLKSGVLAGLANHTLLISRDGSERPIADSGAPIFNAEGNIIGVVLVFSDQSSAREKNRAIERSEKHFRQLFNSMQEGFALHEIITDEQEQAIDYRYLEVNPAFEKLVGKPAEELVGHTVLELFPDTEKYWIERYGKVALGGAADSFENYSQQFNRWFSVAVYSPFLNQFTVLSADITERRLAEEALRASEARFRYIIAAAPRAIIIEQNDRFEYMNSAACKIFEVDSADCLIGQSVSAQFTASCQLELQETLRLVREEEIQQPQLEETIKLAGGSLVEVEVAAVPFIYEDKPGSLIFLHDITLRKQTARRIDHLNHVLRAIRSVNQLIVYENDKIRLIQHTCLALEQEEGIISALIILTDENGNITEYAESGMGENFIHLEEEIKQGILPECCTISVAAEHQNNLTAREEVCPDCVMHDECWAIDNLCLKLQHAGKDYGFLSVTVEAKIGHDTEEQLLFAEIAHDLSFALYAIAQEEAVNAGEIELIRINNELRQAQKMEVVGRLAGGIAHDFNNILTGILGFLDLSLLDVQAIAPVRDDLEEVRRLAVRAAELTRQLLAFSRRQTLEIEVLNLNLQVDNISKMLSRLLGEDVELISRLSGNIGNIKADPGQIEQVVINLAINARDAMPQGGRLIVETANVDFTTINSHEHMGLENREYVMLSFSDSGVGIDAETREHIFEPFFTTKEIGKGTGLGLATVYGIVKQHQGAIYVYSEPGIGTTFKIYLPLVNEEAAKVKMEYHNPKVGDETILLVEDEAAVLKIAERSLRELGYQVVTATSGEEAEEAFAQSSEAISLLLTDVVMPGMTGLELHRRLKLISPNLKVLYMSGYTQNAIVEHGIFAEGEALLQKPFSLTTIAGKVREVLDN